MKKHITAFILFICILSFNLDAAMTGVQSPRFAFISDGHMLKFKKKHGKFFYYPLLSENTSYPLITFNRKYDEILQKNIAVLRNNNIDQSKIDEYKTRVLTEHYVNMRDITDKAMQKNLPLTSVSSNEQLKAFPPSNNLCFYYYPYPKNSIDLKKSLYIDVFTNTLKLNISIAKARGVSEISCIRYNNFALDILRNICLQHFTKFLCALQPITSTSYIIQPEFIVINYDSDLVNFARKQGQYCYFPIPHKYSLLNRYSYEFAYRTVLSKNLEQLTFLGILLSERIYYETTMLNCLYQIVSTYKEQLL